MKNSQWQTTATGSFLTVWGQVKSRGSKVSAALPIFNFTYASANNPGQFYQPALSDPLFDI